MNEYSDIVNEMANAGPRQVVANVDENPEDGAKALDLSQSSGVPPLAVYNDLDGYESRFKSTLAAGIVRNNAQLSDYVTSHPLAPVISNDDYGNLDQFSQGAKQTSGLLNAIKSPKAAFEAGVTGFGKGFAEGFSGPSVLPEGTTPTISSATVDLLGRLMGGIFEGATSAAGGAAQAGYEGVTGDPVGAARFSRDIAAMTEKHMLSGEGAPEITAQAGQMIRLQEARTAAKPWTDAGVEPPSGVHPVIDEAKVGLNQTALKSLNDDLARAQESLTRDRSSDMFRQFTQQHFGDAEIGISGDRVAELYSGREPTPDDGILGWVPGIEDKLAVARETGEDVHVPIADWITRVDSALANQLNDDIRMWPGGITNREAAPVSAIIPDTAEYGVSGGIEPTYHPFVDAPLPAVRGGASLEPMFSIGDRKLTLQRMVPQSTLDAMIYGTPEGTRFGVDQGFHDFQLIDQDGRPAGYLNLSTQKGGKELYVDMISGVGGLGPRDFGPSLMRDLLRQIKAEFPEAETLTGHRVSGSRDKFGTFDQKSALPVIRLDSPELDISNNFQRVLENGQWYNFASGVDAYLRPLTDQPDTVQRAIQVVQDELARIAPKGTIAGPVSKISAEGARGQAKAIEPGGVFIPRRDANSIIMYSLDSRNMLGTARHEAIHHLRQYGFFDDKEWGILKDAAAEHGWVDQFNIKDRYPKADSDLLFEESIADAYKHWAEGGLTEPKVASIFQKLKDFLDRIRQRIGEFLGKDPTWEDIFEKVQSGEVGSREGTTPLFERGASAEVPDEAAPRPSYQDQLDALKASSVGLDAASFKRIQDLIQKRYAEDLEAAQKRAEKSQKQHLTREWRNNRADMLKETEDRLRTRPDIAADLFLGSGELFGKKLDKKYRLATGDLTELQQQALPKHYQARDGLPVDQVAKLFGFTSGDAMIHRLVEYNQLKAGATPQEMFGKLVRDETNRRMEEKYGDLQSNIMDEAKDQALSETNLNLLAEEMYAAATLAKSTAIDKTVAANWAKDQFSKMTLGNVNADRFTETMAKHGRDAERSLINGDPASALVSMQKKYLSALLTSHARAFQKEVAQFEKIADRFRRRVVDNIDPEYTNFIHQILGQVGKPVRRTFEDIQKEISAGESKSLEEFVGNKSAMFREIPIYPDLFDKSWQKNFNELTTDEFRGVHGSVKSLVFNGRDELKLTKAGESADLAMIKQQMMDQLRDFKERHYDIDGKYLGTALPNELHKFLRTALASHLQLETVLNRWDKYDRHGVWNQYIMRPLIEGANQEAAWRKEYAKIITDIGNDGTDLTKSINNTLFRDLQGGPLLPMNRGALRAVILNTGTTSNLIKLARGYNLEPKAVMDWIHTVARKEDWDFAQRVWDEVFKDIKAKSDTMYRSLTGGVPAEDVPATPIDTPWGRYEGGYYPIIYHPDFLGKSKKLMGKDPLEQSGFFSAMTPAGYTKARTGYVAPLYLNLDILPGRISQMLHDIALRPAVINASKVFYDSDIYNTIRKHYGTEYADLLIPYLRDVANASYYTSKASKYMNNWTEFIRQNMITTLVGLNPGTVLKHGPTAWVQSMQEVGSKNYLNAMRSLWSTNEETGESNWQFAMRNSQELQRRDVNWKESLTGAVEDLVPKGQFAQLRSKVIGLASKPVAMSDMISAVPTWLAKYKEAMAENGGIHGDAVYDADTSVRRAHGSTAITNRPGIMRDANPWFTSVYNFFNHIMNRQAEMVWKAGETMDLAKSGGWAEASNNLPALTSQLFAYVIAPAIVEELVSPMTNQQHKSWGVMAAQGLIHTLGASWVGVRDLVNAMIDEKDPSVGLLSTAGKEFTDVIRDLRKDGPVSKDHAGRLIQDAAGLIGTATGLLPQQLGRSARFLYDVNARKERPQGPWGWLTGLRYGTLDKHSTTWDNWVKGK